MLTGTAATNTMNGLNGNDEIKLVGGNDTVDGGQGDDIIDRGNGTDSLTGGQGNDLLWGSNGGDRLFGGAGGDVFVFGAGDRGFDFSRVEGDQVHFAASLGLSEADLVITTTAQGTVIGALGVTGTMLLRGYFGGFDTGNDFKFDYVATFGFL